MRRSLTATAALVAAGATLAAIAAAQPVTAKQRVAIQVRSGNSFALTPLASGAVARDTGKATFCCWSSRRTVRDGQAIEVNDPLMTLTGSRGTLVTRNRIEWVDVPDGWSIFTGTWKVIRATGDYAGLAGHGRVGGVQLANGTEKSLFEGVLGT